MSDKCRDHHYGSDDRCVFCNIRRRFYNECKATLLSWTEKERNNDWNRWTESLSLLECNEHIHDEGDNP